MADSADGIAVLRQKIERAKSDNPDPAERDKALARLEEYVRDLIPQSIGGPKEDLNDLLGLIRTYRGDVRLQQEGLAAK